MSAAATDKVDAISEAGDTIVITRGRNYVAIYYCWWFVEESEINKDDGEVGFYATVAPSNKAAASFPNMSEPTSSNTIYKGVGGRSSNLESAPHIQYGSEPDSPDSCDFTDLI